MTEADKRRRARTTIYLSPDVRRRLKMYCALHDAEMSATIEAALVRYLDGLGKSR